MCVLGGGGGGEGGIVLAHPISFCRFLSLVPVRLSSSLVCLGTVSEELGVGFTFGHLAKLISLSTSSGRFLAGRRGRRRAGGASNRRRKYRFACILLLLSPSLPSTDTGRILHSPATDDRAIIAATPGPPPRPASAFPGPRSLPPDPTRSR